MIFIPAIDLISGRCVRLQQGDYSRKKEYSGNPVATAQSFENEGAGYIHIVDLDAAKGEGKHNRDTIKYITGAVGVPVQVGGGVRSMEEASYLLEMGVSRLVLGTIVVKNPGLAVEMVSKFGEKMVAGIDANEGVVRIRGWTEETAVDAVELGRRARDIGFSMIVYTDIARDGMMEGPNLDAVRRMARATGLSIIAAGGVSRIEDVLALKSLEGEGVEGVIAGRAIYEGTLSVREACSVLAINP
jgi:phosphoribosylformimino-5-aminoimidazole carboxamide ribotide isomerase